MNKLQKIAEILGLTLSSNVVEENLAAEGKLMDGTRIFTEADGFVVGAVVQVETAEGMVLAPAGEHTLEDGNIIEVDENGVILEIKAPEPAEEPAPVAAEEMNDEKPFALSEQDFNALVERIAKLEEVLLGAVESLSKTNKELIEKVETLSAEPAAQPVRTRRPVVEENALAGLKLPKRN